MREDHPRPHFFIVSDGRSGTTLLTSVLGKAGADFGLDVAEDWKSSGGANEHPDLVRTTSALERAEHLTLLATKYPGVSALARLYRSIAKRKVRRLVGKATYHKSSPFMVTYAYKLGYDPRVIASYRQFDALARSKMLLQRLGYPAIVERLEMTYRNALIGIHSFGGCAVGYEELIDSTETGWADALAQLTGLSQDALLEARAVLVKSNREASGPTFHLDPRLDDLFSELTAIKGRCIPPSKQYLKRGMSF